ncbi:MAG: ComF family protein [Saprospiraceae bacterium]|nr:ComF family protein [Saprospiraceae bacterium]
MVPRSLLHAFRLGREGLLDLLFPRLCLSCGLRTLAEDALFCLDCQSQLHPADMYRFPDNEVASRFRGRIELAAGAALYYYEKGTRLQQLMERLKYRGETNIGLSLGAYFGRLLVENEPFRSIEWLVPVPLHPKKQALRGYNQSAWIARGLSRSMGIPVREDLLVRTRETDSQTRKGRHERMQNMSAAFALTPLGRQMTAGHHIALVDDVLTTGATLESCALKFKEASPLCRLSMLTLGMTC